MCPRPLIVCVCTGNTCRSPMAAALLRRALDKRGPGGYTGRECRTGRGRRGSGIGVRLGRGGRNRAGPVRPSLPAFYPGSGGRRRPDRGHDRRSRRRPDRPFRSAAEEGDRSLGRHPRSLWAGPSPITAAPVIPWRRPWTPWPLPSVPSFPPRMHEKGCAMDTHSRHAPAVPPPGIAIVPMHPDHLDSLADLRKPGFLHPLEL